jgi:small subunit ribosomal protein S2
MNISVKAQKNLQNCPKTEDKFVTKKSFFSSNENTNISAKLKSQGVTPYNKLNKRSVSLRKSRISVIKTHVGQILNVKIHGLGPGNLGFIEMVDGFTIFVPNVKIGEHLEIEVKEIHIQKSKYAIAKVLKVLTKSNKSTNRSLVSLDKDQRTNLSSLRVGDIMEVTIEKNGPKNSGLTYYKNFTLIVLKAKVGEKVKIQISRVKKNYAFAKILTSLESKTTSSILKVGFKYTVTLPKTAKYISQYLLVKMQNTTVFIKMGLGAKLGDFVQIQMTKTGENFAVAKIVKLFPMSQKKKQLLVKQNLKKMLACGMHFGERAIRCNANMKKSIWLNVLPKPDFSQILPSSVNKTKEPLLSHYDKEETTTNQKNIQISQENLKNSLKKRPIIRKGRHFINLLKTRRCLTKVLMQLAKYAAKGRTFLFVGTNKSASALIARAAMLSKTSFFVNTRWLGGMLTNWKTILKSIAQIRPILKEKQKIIKNILEKRQKIKKRLILKVHLLRKNSEKLVSKGKNLLAQIQKNRLLFMEKSDKLLIKKTNLLEKNNLLIQKYEFLRQRKILFSNNNQLLQQKGNQLLQQKNLFLRQFNQTQKQILNFEQLFFLGQEILKTNRTAQKQGKTLKVTSFNKLTKNSTLGVLLSPLATAKGPEVEDQGTPRTRQRLDENWIVPNPSNEFFDKIVLMLKTNLGLKQSLNLNMTNKAVTVLDSYTPIPENKLQEKNKSKMEKNNTIILSKLLNKFTRFLPFMKIYIENLHTKLQNLKLALTTVYQNIQKVRQNLKNQNKVLQKIQLELQFIKYKLRQEKEGLNLLKTKLKRLASEQRLLKFLPRLRYLPTPANKMAKTIQILMKKFVDPKMTYPMEQVYDDKLKYTPKKVATIRKQKWQRLEKYFGGIAKMAKMKKKQLSNNVAIIIGQKEEMNAVQECKKLGIPIFSILDTNNNPRFANHWIPANDDSRNSVKFVLEEMLKRICLAQKLRSKLVLRKIRKTTKARSL